MILHEAHRPAKIDGLGQRKWLRLLSYQPFTAFYTQIQYQFPIDPVNAIVVPGITPHLA
jgi:hypothetical protein